MKENNQPGKKYYFGDYDTPLRFVSYFTQIDLIKGINPSSILEIGIGNKTVSSYLKNKGFSVTTLDFDGDLDPDVIGDVRKIPLKDNQFDLVIACEILEHIPFEDFEKAMLEIKRLSKKSVIISLPYSSINFDFAFRIPWIRKLFKKEFFRFCFSLPLFFKKFEFDGKHYWEMGRKNYSIGRIRKIIEKEFIIKKEISPLLNQYHHFFVLEKKI